MIAKLVVAWLVALALSLAGVAQAHETGAPHKHRHAKAGVKQPKPTAHKKAARHSKKFRHAAFEPASPEQLVAPRLSLRSAAVLVQDQETGETIVSRNAEQPQPIASITKLMTAMVTLDAALPMDEVIEIVDEDVDMLKGSRSKLRVGAALTRDYLLRLALMASENRAAAALSRAYPGGRTTFIAAMNRKAQDLGMIGTRFADATGLTSNNVSTASDLALMVDAAYEYPVIRDYSTAINFSVPVGRRVLAFHNTNALVRAGRWEIGLSKTGYINEAGRCLVMQARLSDKPVIIVLLDSWGRNSRIGDANRIRKWLESGNVRRTSA